MRRGISSSRADAPLVTKNGHGDDMCHTHGQALRLYLALNQNVHGMKKVELKQKILDAGKAEHQTVIDDYRNEIKRLQEGEMGVFDGQMDDQQMAYNNEVNERINHLAEQLNFAVDEMNLLNRLIVEEPLHKEVMLGSVVDTDKRKFFVSVSIEEFTVGRTEYFGLSTKTPLYKEMAGKKKGDKFALRNMKYVIKDVF
jgi:hypothetical protein